MENLFDLDIDHIKHGGTEVTLMKLNGDIIYKKAPYYVPYQFRGDTSLIEVETNVGKRNTNLSNMFADCSNLVSVNTQDWNTSNVTTMERTFYYCGSLTELDLSNWDTSRVTNMYQMFAECNSLRTLNVSNWDISRVTNMRGIFGWSEKLETLDLSNWVLPDSTNVQNLMDNMFYNCNSLQNLRLDNCDSNTIRWLIDQNPNNSAITSFPTNAIEGVTKTIYCKRENALGITVPTNWVFRYVNVEGIPEYLPGEFKNQKYLVSIETDVNASHTNLSGMLSGCKALISVNTQDWDTSNVTTMKSMFRDCESLPELNLSNFNTSNVTEMGWMFCECHSLEELNVSNFDTSNVIDMVCMFDDCQSLTSLDVSNFNTSNVIDMQNMFYNCQSLTSLDLSSWDTSTVKYMRNMFYGCSKLAILDLSNWKMDSIVTSVAGGVTNMFAYCSSLHTLYLNNCSEDTVRKIINTLTTYAIDGVTKTIYCDKVLESVGLSEPKNWTIQYV